MSENGAQSIFLEKLKTKSRGCNPTPPSPIFRPLQSPIEMPSELQLPLPDSRFSLGGSPSPSMLLDGARNIPNLILEENSEDGDFEERRRREEEEEMNMMESFSTNHSGFEIEFDNSRGRAFFPDTSQQIFNTAFHKKWRNDEISEFEPMGNKKLKFNNTKYRRMRSESENLSDFSIMNFLKLGRHPL